MMDEKKELNLQGKKMELDLYEFDDLVKNESFNLRSLFDFQKQYVEIGKGIRLCFGKIPVLESMDVATKGINQNKKTLQIIQEYGRLEGDNFPVIKLNSLGTEYSSFEDSSEIQIISATSLYIQLLLMTEKKRGLTLSILKQELVEDFQEKE